jgi:hypothetical protein
MGSASFQASTLGRGELEDTWRGRLEECQKQYQDASHSYRKLLAEEPDGQPPRPESPLARARQAESEALTEYSRVLRLFTDLTVHGKLPEETLHGERGVSKET